jgi:lysophospholipase L1-like esterase
MKLNKQDTILFIGDSITDVERNREDSKDLGKGYPLLTAAYLLERYPELNLSFLNRGISGDEITDLSTRWKEDCLVLKPDIISILIGINDVWHNMDMKELSVQESVDKFEFYYRILLETAKEQTKAQIVLVEPFVLKNPEELEAWKIELEPRKQIIHKLADEYDADYIELDDKLNKFGNKWGNDYVTVDGVHPTPAGHAIISKSWLEQINQEKLV